MRKRKFDYTMIDRRCAMRALLGGIFFATLPGRSASGSVTDALYTQQELEQGPLEVTRLADEMVLVSGAGGNVVAADSAEGIVMVDGGIPERSEEMLDCIFSELAGDHVNTLFNTHWHPDSVGCNEHLGGSSTRIVAHENTRLWLTTEIARPWDQTVHRPLPSNARPNHTFYTSEQLSVGDRTMRASYMLQAHTDGDIFVQFPDENVLVAGGVASSAGWPLIDWWTGGWILGMVDGLDRLIEASDDQTRIVPGHGPLLSRADLIAHRDMFLVVYERLIQLFFQGKSPVEAVEAEPTREFDAKWGDPEMFVTLAFQSFWPQFAPNV